MKGRITHMKKIIGILLMVIALSSLLAVTAFAAGPGSSVVKGGSSPNWTYTATLDGNDPKTPTTIQNGDMFVLIVLKSSALPQGGGFPSSLTADAILYIDQMTATTTDASNDTIVFPNFIPMTDTNGKAFIAGGSLNAPVSVGTLGGQVLWGDINNDTSSNSTDAGLALRYSSGIITLSSDAVARGDVNGDKSLNSTDAALILRHSSGIITKFPVEG
jgi:hypothetical protein